MVIVFKLIENSRKRRISKKLDQNRKIHKRRKDYWTKNVCQEKDTRIFDLQKQIDIKDEQLKMKDNQIEKLSETMHAQAIHIQSLINQKAI